MSVVLISYRTVKNHGIPQETIDKALAASKEFFSLPIEKKIEEAGFEVRHYASAIASSPLVRPI